MLEKLFIKITSKIDLRKLAPRGQGITYGAIREPLDHLEKHYGPGWALESQRIVEGFSPLRMADFPGENHCSLVSLTALLEKDLARPREEIFQDLRELALDQGYYSPGMGTFSWYIARLAGKFLQENKLEIQARNRFFFLTTRSLENFLRRELDRGHRGTISFTSGDYGFHTCSYYGYRTYRRGEATRTFLLVNDNWTRDQVFVDLARIGSLSTSLFQICSLRKKR